jgi:single-strand DNA-binding protein
MAKGLNKVMLIGHLGNDPESKITTSGQTRVNFTLATNENFKDSNGNLQERTEWHRIIVWGKLAEICSQYLKKGRQVYIEGRLQTRSWDDTKSGEKRYTTEIICSDMQMLGGQREQGGGQGSEGSPDQQPPPAAPSVPMLEHEKDDLPF